MKKHRNIALFVPHNGCPHQCSFCNQRTISGHDSQPTPEDVGRAIEIAGESGTDDTYTELAFFGGSFTAIDRDYMISLLEAARPYYEKGMIDGIRCSTRPDCIDDEILTLLKKYHVTAIELGAQSMRDSVLCANHRGHDSRAVEQASRLISSYGFELGLQMMTGLYGSTPEDDIYTAQKLIELAPDTVRIYPTVVLRGTELEQLYIEGKYDPPDAVCSAPLCARLIKMFERNGIRVIRVGLHAEKSLEQNRVAGAYHQAMRELCESVIFLDRMKELLSERQKNGLLGEGARVTVRVCPKELSKALGQKKANIAALKAEGYDVLIKADPELSAGQVVI